MRKPAKAALAAVSIAAASPAWAESWTYVTSDVDETHQEYVDTDSIRRSGTQVRYMRERRFPGTQRESGVVYTRIRMSELIDCRAATLQEIKVEYYNGAAMVFTGRPMSDDILPGTVLEGVMEFVCGTGDGSIAPAVTA